MKLSQLSLADYNQLDSIPVINQDLSATDFIPVVNTYYKHTGTTTASYINGVIYYYSSTGYVALDGSAVGLATVAKTGSYNDLRNIPTDIAKIGNLSNPNLLINPNFAINQRGRASYTASASASNVYCVDRWYLYGSGTFDTSSKEVSLLTQNSLFWQSIENYNDLKGKTLTFSISVSNVRGNALYMKVYGGQDIHITTDGIYTVTTTLSTSITKFGCGLSRSTNVTGEASCVVNWAKLEIGSVATEFSPPSIAEELPKCQRYYRKYLGGISGISLVGEFYAASTTDGYAKIYIGNMRSTPTIGLSKVEDIKIGFSTPTFESNVVNKMQYNDITQDKSIYKAYIKGIGFVSGQAYFLGIAKDGYIAFDAEL